VFYSLTVGLIQDLQLSIEDRLRPAIRDDMMEGLEQNVLLLAELQQFHPQHGSIAQIERLFLFALDRGRHLPALLSLIELAEVIERQPDQEARLDDLDRPAIDLHKAGTQALVPIDDGLDRTAERLDVELSPQLQRQRHVVFGARSSQLIDEPQPLLRIR